MYCPAAVNNVATVYPDDFVAGETAPKDLKRFFVVWVIEYGSEHHFVADVKISIGNRRLAVLFVAGRGILEIQMWHGQFNDLKRPSF